LVVASLSLALGSTAPAQEPGGAEEQWPRFRLGVEVKANYRDSDELSFPVKFPFPPELGQVSLETPSPGQSLELSNVALIGEGELTPHIRGRVKIHVIDLYDRNPTSSDEVVSVREAWLAFGTMAPTLEIPEGSTFYLLAGKAPRFTKQLDRRLESYGLWGTAVGRFEQVQLQLGGTLGRHVYWRAHAASPNPLFFRDPNALAGDNGTPERTPEENDPIYGSGFPIIYDTKASDVNPTGEWETGAGLGLRIGAPGGGDGLDVLAWYFERELADLARIHGTYYEGELELLAGVGIPLPVEGRDKVEFGANLQARLGGLRLFGQYVDQEIAGLGRTGFEVEAAWRFPLAGLFASGDQPVVTSIQPAVRYSTIDNDFVGPAEFVAPSMFWDWEKIDAGVRIGIVRGTDLTLEFARNRMTLLSGRVLEPGEFLATLRFVL
jgi:hypothetical protein